jgi:hypothetical protein
MNTVDTVALSSAFPAPKDLDINDLGMLLYILQWVL